MIGSTLVRHWRLWAPPLALTLVNLAVLVTYQLAFAGSVEQLRGQVDAERARAEGLAAKRAQLVELVLDARRSRTGIEQLYARSFGSESERLTAWIREVKDLAEQSGLSPSTINYPKEDLDDFGLERRSFEFQVTGDYSGLRQFINLLELTDSFIVLESVTLTESEPQLRISLVLSTLFSETGDGEGA